MSKSFVALTMTLSLFVAVAVAVCVSQSVMAEEPAPTSVPATSGVPPEGGAPRVVTPTDTDANTVGDGEEASAPPKASTSRNSKGKRSSEKENEGTEARNRFQADTVLKSKYHYNGEPLEVDPD